MERTAIIEKLTAVFHEVFNDNNIVLNDEMTSKDVENWDSITHMLMVAMVEKTFSIKMKLRDINKVNTVGNLIDLIHEKINE